MIEGKECETARQHVASHRPRMQQMAVIDLQAAHHDDEHAVGEHHGQLGEEYLWSCKHKLQGRPEHALIVHACRQFVQRAQHAGEHQRGEERPLAIGKTQCHQHERQKEQRLYPVDGVAEVSAPAHP